MIRKPGSGGRLAARRTVLPLILAASSRLVSEKLDDEKHRGLVRDYIEDLSKTS